MVRNWKFSKKVIKDVITVLRLGKRMILKCFLDIKRLFKFDEAKYPLNLLYIDDYCVYLQTLSKNKIKPYIKEIMALSVQKHDLGWDLGDIEKEAKEFERLEGNPSEFARTVF